MSVLIAINMTLFGKKYFYDGKNVTGHHSGPQTSSTAHGAPLVLVGLNFVAFAKTINLNRV